MPFFGSSLNEVSGPRKFKVPQCASCGLYRRCTTPKMQPTGKGKRSILILLDAPSEEDDERGHHYTGGVGNYLKAQLHRVGIDMRRDCILHYSVICHPTTRDKKSRAATDKEIECCSPNVQQAIETYKPKVIIAVGHTALKAALTGVWTNPLYEIERWVGWRMPIQQYNVWLCPVFHPTYIKTEERLTNGNTIIELLFHQHLKGIAELTERPWTTIPDYKEHVKVLLNEDQIVFELKKMLRREGSLAFDYETNMLKPDAPDSRIVAASVCISGEYTIAFPFGDSRVIALFKRLITSKRELISQNLKFEDRWTRVQLKVRPRTWAWDTMNEGHVLDNRTHCTALDFQALVHLGFGSWDSYVSPYLRANHSYERNNIHKVDFASLCLYCGIDSHVTFHLANVQRKALGLPALT